MVQQLDQFSTYCRNLGLLVLQESFKQHKSTLDETLLIHLLNLNREQLIELTSRLQGYGKIIKEIKYKNLHKKANQIKCQLVKYIQNLVLNQIISMNNIYQMKRIKQLKEMRMHIQTLNYKKEQKLELNSPAHIRLNNYAIDSKIKLQIVQELNQKQELKDCTFKPSINTKSIGRNQSAENPFDRLYQNALTQRNNTPKNNEDSQFTYRPQLISSPMKLQQFEGISVEDRLYNHHFEKINNVALKQEELQQMELEQCTFTPAINHQGNVKQNEKVFERLYNHSSVKSISDVKDHSISHMNKNQSLQQKNRNRIRINTYLNFNWNPIHLQIILRT
ncbi:unnamed protein product [Paramecium sonneborni]|uniref:Uncharacterized protein n=1 Tax=Paramecium sonneborni TaxID=65129 RepID=A0A8S1RPD9_9CILI|nr:unnamed protein product [Paramecium sonneborni]